MNTVYAIARRVGWLYKCPRHPLPLQIFFEMLPTSEFTADLESLTKNILVPRLISQH